ncbi:hypothetical protein PBRA_003072 [Plasmodiophora brassicae]|uniref:Uncharacterized protein n=1 Tax=Plasmodiophora brassicae TaxID=37360 RepID=A0A0G4J716_PLABS|nr:hypothetical protein PBRA_003072 [Plasmodiophora brassicae]
MLVDIHCIGRCLGKLCPRHRQRIPGLLELIPQPVAGSSDLRQTRCRLHELGLRSGQRSFDVLHTLFGIFESNSGRFSVLHSTFCTASGFRQLNAQTLNFGFVLARSFLDEAYLFQVQAGLVLVVDGLFGAKKFVVGLQSRDRIANLAQQAILLLDGHCEFSVLPDEILDGHGEPLRDAIVQVRDLEFQIEVLLLH